MISPSERQSALLVQKVNRMAVKKLGLTLKKDGIHKVSVVFPNGSTIVGLPENEEKFRGSAMCGCCWWTKPRRWTRCCTRR